MATITISVSTDNGLNFSRDILLADADVLRILAASNYAYVRDYSNPPLEELVAKKDEVFNKVVDIFFGMIRTTTRDFEIAQVRVAAENSVSPIEAITPPAPEGNP